MEEDVDIYLDDCLGCDNPIYSSDPHEAYIDGGEDFLETMVFIAHHDCSVPAQFVRLTAERPRYDSVN